MKFIASIFLLVLLIGSVSAISVNLDGVYSGKETMIIEIEGSILEPIVKGDIEFKRANVRVPLEFDVKRLGDRTYIWAIAPTEEGDYTLLINEIASTSLGSSQIVDFQQNFSVINLTDYNVKPGFEFALEDFEVEIYLFEDTARDISINFGGEGSLSLKPGENTFTLNVEDFEQGLVFAEIGDYSMPVYIAKKSGFSSNGKFVERVGIFPIEIKRVVSRASNLFYPIRIKNEGDVRIDFIEVWSNNPNIKISPEKFDNLSVEGEIEFNLSIEEIFDSRFEDVVYVQTGDIVHIIPLTLDLLASNESSEDIEEGYYCVELGGQICDTSKTCSGEIQGSIDGSCCLSVCEEPPSSSGSSGIIGWLLFGIVIVGGIILWVKFKKAKPSKSGLDKALAPGKPAKK